MSSVEIEQLLTHAEWVRRLARRLVDDPSMADDVEQETWLNAVRKPPAKRGADVRPWLARVVHNAAATLRRRELPRERRERAAARAEALPSAQELAAEGELQASEKLTQAAAVLGTEKQALTLRYLQTMIDISAEKTSTVLFPLPIELLDAFEGFVKRRAESGDD